MSASPPATSAPSQKRPLEEPSSPSGVGEQPDAKRPALDKIVSQEAGNDVVQATGEAVPSSSVKVKGEAADITASVEHSVSDGQGDTVVPDAPIAGMPSSAQVLQTQPIQSTIAANGRATSQGPGAFQQQDETNWLHLRSIISSAEAATVIGKGGENVSQIRRMSGAKCTVSDYSRGAVERILTVSGLTDAVAKVGWGKHNVRSYVDSSSRLLASSLGLSTTRLSTRHLPPSQRHTLCVF